MEQPLKTSTWASWVAWLVGFVLAGVLLYFLAPELPQEVLPWAVGGLGVVAGLYLGWIHPEGGGPTFGALRKVVGLACIGLALAFVITIVPRTGGGFALRLAAVRQSLRFGSARAGSISQQKRR